MMRIYYNYSYEKNPNICRSNLYADWLNVKKGNEETLLEVSGEHDFSFNEEADGVGGRVKGDLFLDGKVLTNSEIDKLLDGATGIEFGLFEEDVLPEHYNLRMTIIAERGYEFQVSV